MILIPNPPPMSWEVKSIWSIPIPSAGAIIIAANIGNWLFDLTAIALVPGSQSTRAPKHSSGVDEKRWKWSLSILTTWSACSSAQSMSPKS